ncbi:MAG: hypothetical protein J5662_03310 [Clostridia bacterium]|nr:hypothetical protein [Clostridia bacterium]
MNNTQKTDDTEMLTDIYKNCKMGVESTAKLMPKVQNADMRLKMGDHLKQYQGFAARAADHLARQGKAPADAGFFEKLPAEVGMAMSQMMDSSDSKTAQMMINGYVMGVAELKKQLSDTPNISEHTAALAADMIQFQLNAINDMKQFL